MSFIEISGITAAEPLHKLLYPFFCHLFKYKMKMVRIDTTCDYIHQFPFPLGTPTTKWIFLELLFINTPYWFNNIKFLYALQKALSIGNIFNYTPVVCSPVKDMVDLTDYKRGLSHIIVIMATTWYSDYQVVTTGV